MPTGSRRPKTNYFLSFTKHELRDTKKLNLDQGVLFRGNGIQTDPNPDVYDVWYTFFVRYYDYLIPVFTLYEDNKATADFLSLAQIFAYFPKLHSLNKSVTVVESAQMNTGADYWQYYAWFGNSWDSTFQTFLQENNLQIYYWRHNPLWQTCGNYVQRIEEGPCRAAPSFKTTDVQTLRDALNMRDLYRFITTFDHAAESRVNIVPPVEIEEDFPLKPGFYLGYYANRGWYIPNNFRINPNLTDWLWSKSNLCDHRYLLLEIEDEMTWLAYIQRSTSWLHLPKVGNVNKYTDAVLLAAQPYYIYPARNHLAFTSGSSDPVLMSLLPPENIPASEREAKAAVGSFGILKNVYYLDLTDETWMEKWFGDLDSTSSGYPGTFPGDDQFVQDSNYWEKGIEAFNTAETARIATWHQFLMDKYNLDYLHAKYEENMQGKKLYPLGYLDYRFLRDQLEYRQKYPEYNSAFGVHNP